jgi:tetratricopeptide (TPR) repeat protein
MYLEEERDPQKALEILKSSSETLPPQVLELYQASIAARSLDLETARQLLGSLKLPEAALLRAAVIIGLDQREEAEKALQDIAENHPDGTTRLKAQSLLYTYQQFDVHREAPKSYLWTLLAQKLESFQEWEISLLLAEKASNENPQYRDAHIIQGVNHLHLKNYEEALNSLLKALSLDPGNSYVQYLLGVSYREQQEYEQSDEYLQYSLHSSEDYRDLANLLLAQNAEDQQLSEVAIHYYQQVLSGQGDQTFAHSRLAFLKAQHSKDYDRAEYHAKKYYDLTEGSAKSLQLLSWIYGLQGKSEEALELLSTPY